MNLIYTLKKQVKRLRYLAQGRNRSTAFPLVDKKGLSEVIAGNAYIHDDEIALFARIAKNAIGPIVEIGAASGASASVFLLHSSAGVKIRSIDPFVQYGGSEKKCRKNVYWILRAHGERARYADWAVFPDYSYNVVKTWKEPIEILFIDGDHAYEAAKKDFEDWYPFVKKGGKILIHDSRKELGTPESTFNRGWPGPTKLAGELRSSPKVKLVEEVYSVTVWEKI